MTLKIQKIACGGHHSFVLLSDGSVWAAGCNDQGQLGDGTYQNQSTWTSVMPPESSVVHLVVSNNFSLALKSDGSLWATGWNGWRQLGQGVRDKKKWTSVISSGVTQVTAGDDHSLVLKSDGSLWKTGHNDRGQLGHEGSGSLVWVPDRFFEHLLLQSVLNHESEDDRWGAPGL